MHPALTIAKRAALSASRILLRHFDNLERLSVTAKQRNDFVSEADVQAEQEIIQTLRKTYPNHGILAEESGEQHGHDDYQWVIDPLDGTTNFLHGIPHFAISIGFRHKNRLEAGLVYDPIRQEMFTASRGAGAQMNDRRMRVSNIPQMENALLGTGFRSVTPAPARLSQFLWQPVRQVRGRCAGPARPRWIWPTWPPAGWMATGSSA